MKLKKRTIKALVNLVLFFSIIGAIYAALNSSWIHDRYFAILENSTGWRIQADKISINPFFLSVEIRGVNVESRSRRQLLAADHIYVRVSPLSLVRGRIIVSRLEVNDVYLSFQRYKGPKRKWKSKRKSLFTIVYIKALAKKIVGNFAVQNIQVESGHIGPLKILAEKRKGGFTHVDLADFKFDLRQTLLRRNDFNFSAKQLLVNDKIIASGLEVEADVSGGRVVVKSFRMSRPEGTYELTLDAKAREKMIHGDLVVKAELPKIFQKPIHLEGQVKLLPPHLIMEPVSLSVGDLTVTTKAQMQLPSLNYQIKADVAETVLAAVWQAFRLLSVTGITGKASLSGEMKARIPELKIEAELIAEPVSYAPFHVPQLVASVSVNGRSISWEARSPGSGPVRLSSRGTVVLQGKSLEPKIQELTVEFNDVNLAAMVKNDVAAGRVSGRVELHEARGGLSGAGQLSLAQGRIGGQVIEQAKADFEFSGNKMRVTRLALQVPAIPELITTAPLDILFGSERVSIDGSPLPGLVLQAHYQKNAKLWRLESLKYQSAGHVFTATGQYHSNGTFQVSTRGGLDASVLRFIRSVFNDASGIIQMNLRASGSVKRPQFSGNIEFQRVMMDLRGMGDPVQDFNGRIRIQHNRVTLDNIQGLHGDGNFHANGSVTIDGLSLRAFNVALTGNALTFRFRGAMQVDFDAELKVEGALPSPRVSGNIDLIAGRYYKNFILTKAVFDDRFDDQIRDERETDFFNEWRWDIQVRNSGDLRIENNVADVFLAGDMHLKGTTQKPVIQGIVTTTGGELHYLGHDMEITEGTLEFRDPNRVNPYLTLLAQEEISGAESRGIRSFFTVNAHVEGPLDNLRVTLSSSPPVDQADVVSLLAFGMTQSQLREQGSARRAFATSLVANSLTSGFGESLAGTVGLDVLRFESAAGSSQAISGVALGKNLSDRLSVEFYTDITPQTAQRRIRSKYFLTDNIFLEGTNTVVDDRTKFELNISLQFQMR